MTTLLPRTRGGLAGDLHGDPAGGARAFVLVHGLTFDRRMWEPVLPALAAHPVLVVDLPGHGDSPALPSHRLPHVVAALHETVEAAGLEAPVVVGHSLGAGVAAVYAAGHPAAAVVTVDSSPWLEPMAQLLRSLAPRLRDGGFDEIWPRFAESMHRERLPAGADALLRAGDEVSGELVLSYWSDLLDRPVEETMRVLEADLRRARAARVPYLGVHGNELRPGERAWVEARIPEAEHVVWPVGHHFPHLAHPDRFAALLIGLAAALPLRR